MSYSGNTKFHPNFLLMHLCIYITIIIPNIKTETPTIPQIKKDIEIDLITFIQLFQTHKNT